MTTMTTITVHADPDSDDCLQAAVHTRIATLRTEAAAHGDEAMVEMCDRAEDYELYGYDTAEPMSPDELGVSITQYVELICESLDEQSGTGAVESGTGHTVYAQ